MAAKRHTSKKTTRKLSAPAITTTSEFVQFPRPLRNNGKGNEDGPIIGIEVMFALNSIRKGSKEIGIVYKAHPGPIRGVDCSVSGGQS